MIQLEEAGKVPNVMSPLGDTVTLTERVESLALRSGCEAFSLPYHRQHVLQRFAGSTHRRNSADD